MIINRIKAASFLLACSLPFFSSANELDWNTPLNGIRSEVITPNYLQFSLSAQTLHDSANALCSTPTQEMRLAAQTAFNNNVADWQKVQWLNFGPATLFMRYNSFAYWPDKKGLTQRQLRRLIKDDVNTDDNNFWRNASIAVRGLTAIESILYRSDLDPVKQPEYCALLVSISAYHSQSTSDIYAEWKTGQFQDWVFLDEDEEENLTTAALEQFLQQWLEHLSMVKESKLEQTLGLHSQSKKANLKLAEFYRSKQTIPSIQHNIQMYHEIYHAGTPSLFDLALQRYPQQAKKLEQTLTVNIDAAKNLPANVFTNELTQLERKNASEKLVTSLSNTQKQLTDLVLKLGFRIGFNSRDGD